MTINKNILNIIMSTVALNQWKSRMKLINIKYLKKFEYSNYDSCVEYVCKCGFFFRFHWRDIGNVGNIYNYRLKKTHNRLSHAIRTIKIPKKYWYTSGQNHPNGYKKIE